MTLLDIEERMTLAVQGAVDPEAAHEIARELLREIASLQSQLRAAEGDRDRDRRAFTRLHIQTEAKLDRETMLRLGGLSMLAVDGIISRGRASEIAEMRLGEIRSFIRLSVSDAAMASDETKEEG